jgi:6-pyruvoyltetrahydropterin/6-carboxytetrahydropterin synthase
VFRIGVRKRFSAAHSLKDHPGRCARLHGHTWHVEAVFTSAELDGLGMALDFDEADRLLGEVINPLDHSYLNELAVFASSSPTAENVARLIFEALAGLLAASGFPAGLESVKVWESPDSWAAYGA